MIEFASRWGRMIIAPATFGCTHKDYLPGVPFVFIRSSNTLAGSFRAGETKDLVDAQIFRQRGSTGSAVQALGRVLAIAA